ncbi:MAG: phosphomethylpyrimidine synthase ThiC [Candidatus Margulisbacteria bacterium]|nr:phosphomethylpyrimidine synthase ThiC [Candidatus Margulisiibacteriota bacterium]MBU1616191.1 phosphomethylpyrimidine synthase ThiC [Candidatus Margulisiibacteriota bacterium]MBU1866887.1 phosphomethylpyrimidine synthase ThiC [Candidatus Margulisiibacteriota bacterium]
MTTQRQAALKGVITPQMKQVARDEGTGDTVIRDGVAKGTIAIPFNKRHRGVKAIGIGKGLRTKVNANIGTSADFPQLKNELKKLKAALDAKTDALMDLSTGGDINATRKAIMSACPVPVGTVPIYQMVVEKKMTVEGMFSVVEAQAKEGVDFMTIHCGVTRASVAELKKHPRLMDVVSRGGALMMKWILDNDQENPFYEHYDRLLEIAAKYDVTMSLGDGMRPGSVVDAGDAAQIKELKILGQLTKEAWRAGVQVIIEGPGHVPYDQIVEQMSMQKKYCYGAPFYVLGPLPTDVAPGYDHITAAIGGTLAAASGADFLCYVTPTEHLGLPEADDVKEGVIASRIAAHCADIAKGIPGAIEWDRAMSKARKELNWGKQIALAIDPEKAREIHEKRRGMRGQGIKGLDAADVCSMCGEFCAMKVSSEALK